MRIFATLRWQDQCMIALSVLLAVSVTVGVAITSKEEIYRWAYRQLNKAIEKLESMTALFRDDEPFDASWMDADKWRETRL